jgi:hypothetical protein
MEEFARGAALVGVTLSDEEAAFEFEQCDSSGDGTIVRVPTYETCCIERVACCWHGWSLTA